MLRVRMLIWTPLNAAELQKAMHSTNVGPAALIPVQSGTVLLPSLDIKLNEAALMASRVRRIAGGATLAVWNADAAVVYIFSTSIGRASSWGTRDAVLELIAQAQRSGPIAKLFNRASGVLVGVREREKWQRDAVERLATVFPGADRDAALERVRDFANGAGAVPAFLRAVGLPDVALVAELAEQGRADSWLGTLAPPRPPTWPLALIVPGVLMIVVAAILLGVPSLLAGAIAGALTLSLFLSVRVLAKQLVARKPINAVLPVIPVTQGAAPTD